MSQIFSHPLDPTWLSIPFAKFSHNSCPYGTRNFTWNHVGARNDLDFILRHTRVADENGNFHMRILMKINAGAEELVRTTYMSTASFRLIFISGIAGPRRARSTFPHV